MRVSVQFRFLGSGGSRVVGDVVVGQKRRPEKVSGTLLIELGKAGRTGKGVRNLIGAV
jgi:hypothetical protein